MLKFQWHKLSDKNKGQIKKIRPLIYLPAPIFIEPKRIKEIITKYTSDATLILGVSTNKYVTGLEGSPQFKTLTEKQLDDTLSTQNKESNKIAILKHQPEFTKYIIRELKPDKTLFINGSWQHVLHYQPEYWECVDADSEIERISPFCSTESAIDYSKEIDQKNISGLQKKISSIKTINPESVIDICNYASKCSWDWNGQTGAAITKNGKIVAVGHNKVLPYQAAMLHEGSIREDNHSPIGQALEYYQTNHAEMEAILDANQQKISLENSELYTTKFPCPFCARVIASSPIDTIYYSGEYTNNLGYKMLESVGKKLIKI